MKTINEVRYHVYGSGYKKDELGKICGFLIGQGLKDVDEKLVFKTSGDRTFEDFLKWYNDEEKNEPKFDTSLVKVGSFVHVGADEDVIALGCVVDGALVGVNDEFLFDVYELDENSRLCDDNEKEELLKGLHECGILFNEKGFYFDPSISENELKETEKKYREGIDALSDFLNKLEGCLNSFEK